MNAYKKEKSRKAFPIYWIIFLLFVIVRLVNRYQSNDVSMDYGCEDVLQAHADLSEMTRGWRDYNNRSYCIEYVGFTNDRISSTKFRNELEFPRIIDYRFMWRELYLSLYELDKPKISSVCDSLATIRDKYGLNQSQFANTIVSFIQDIDYVYVLDGNACGTEDYPVSGCIDKVKFGIYSPVEFLAGWVGDCDTRALLLYTILKHFGFDVGIAISREYQHAMLIMKMPAAGDYIRHEGAKYYFWETTAKNWVLGSMPPRTRDISKWTVVID